MHLWLRIPALVRAVAAGLFVGWIGIASWSRLLAAFNLFSRGQPEWQLTDVPAPTIWQVGLDASFLANLAAFAVVGTMAGLAYRGLFRARR